ncbi:MAG: response regulator [Deltaproteobacteria bacterium]|nr:response regulator [Deltaproteobacteria bacterium]
MDNATANDRALVVDDDPEICELVSRIMAFRKIETDVAHNGEEAIAYLKMRNYQLAFLDIMLPDVTGMDLLEHAKAISPSTQFFVVSGYVTLLNAMAAMRMGAFAMVLKPIEDIDAMLVEVDLALGRTRHWRKMFSDLQKLKRAANGGAA